MATATARPRPIVDVHLDDLLNETIQRGASDLHLTVGVPPIMRIDGQLKPELRAAHPARYPADRL